MGKMTPDVNDAAPDFKVLTASNELFQLRTAMKGSHNILLIFYRGHW